MKHGLLYEDTVVEVITPAPGSTIDDYVSGDRVMDYIDIPDHVTTGYTSNPDGTFSPPKEKALS
jgi:hypothetical protein